MEFYEYFSQKLHKFHRFPSIDPLLKIAFIIRNNGSSIEDII